MMLSNNAENSKWSDGTNDHFFQSQSLPVIPSRRHEETKCPFLPGLRQDHGMRQSVVSTALTDGNTTSLLDPSLRFDDAKRFKGYVFSPRYSNTTAASTAYLQLQLWSFNATVD